MNRSDLLNYIALPPFRPRLLVPPAYPRVQARSFALYSPGSLRGKLLKWCGAAAARVGLMNLAGRFWAAPVDAVQATEEIRPILDEKTLVDLRGAWKGLLGEKELFCALFLGEPTPYRKITALVFDRGAEVLAFAKAGCTSQAVSLIANERMALENIRLSVRFQSTIIPTLLGHGETGPASWILESPLVSGRPSPAVLQREHIDFLADMSRSTAEVMPLQASDVWRRLHDALNEPLLSIKPEFQAERPFIAKLVRQFQTMRAEDTQRSWPFSAAHGDFAPWNMRVEDGQLALFDWEYFFSAAPAGWDLLYFIVRVENLIRKKPLERIWNEIEAGAFHNKIALWEEQVGLRIPDRRLLGSLVIIAIAFDVIPESISAGKSFERFQ